MAAHPVGQCLHLVEEPPVIKPGDTGHGDLQGAWWLVAAQRIHGVADIEPEPDLDRLPEVEGLDQLARDTCIEQPCVAQPQLRM